MSGEHVVPDGASEAATTVERWPVLGFAVAISATLVAASIASVLVQLAAVTALADSVPAVSEWNTSYLVSAFRTTAIFAAGITAQVWVAARFRNIAVEILTAPVLAAGMAIASTLIWGASIGPAGASVDASRLEGMLLHPPCWCGNAGEAIALVLVGRLRATPFAGLVLAWPSPMRASMELALAFQRTGGDLPAEVWVPWALSTLAHAVVIAVGLPVAVWAVPRLLDRVGLVSRQ